LQLVKIGQYHVKGENVFQIQLLSHCTFATPNTVTSALLLANHTQFLPYIADADSGLTSLCDSLEMGSHFFDVNSMDSDEKFKMAIGWSVHAFTVASVKMQSSAAKYKSSSAMV
jgi:hypothetical protein